MVKFTCECAIYSYCSSLKGIKYCNGKRDGAYKFYSAQSVYLNLFTGSTKSKGRRFDNCHFIGLLRERKQLLYFLSTAGLGSLQISLDPTNTQKWIIIEIIHCTLQWPICNLICLVKDFSTKSKYHCTICTLTDYSHSAVKILIALKNNRWLLSHPARQ